MSRVILFWLGLLLTLGAPLGLIMQKERVLRAGTLVLLPLAPRDPRSLMQGDYMVLRYALASELTRDGDGTARLGRGGHVVLRVDADGVATFVRLHDGRPALDPGEHLLRYRVRNDEMRLGAESFFFQEGQSERFSTARYGELRLNASGEAVLVGLRDEKRQPLKADEAPQL